MTFTLGDARLLYENSEAEIHKRPHDPEAQSQYEAACAVYSYAILNETGDINACLRPVRDGLRVLPASAILQKIERNPVVFFDSIHSKESEGNHGIVRSIVNGISAFLSVLIQTVVVPYIFIGVCLVIAWPIAALTGIGQNVIAIVVCVLFLLLGFLYWINS